MAFINNSKFLEIRQAGKDGNEKAKMILQAMRKGGSQEDIDRLVGDYYSVPNVEEPETQEVDLPVEQTYDNQPETQEQDIPQELEPEIVESSKDVEDLTSILDLETDGLFDENDIETLNFNDYLSNKKKDSLRSKKNSDYFKAYNMEGRQKYLQDKINKYKEKFNGKIRDIDRKYDDITKSLDFYSMKVNDMLDDNIDMNMDSAGSAYNEFTDSPEIMQSFGRHWDEKDSNDVVFALSELCKKYGKKNIVAALNTLRNDNENYKKFLNGQIDTEIGRYSKSIENLLK